MQEVEQQLKPNVVRIRYDLDYDSTGDPAVKFRVVLPDSSSEEFYSRTDDVRNDIIDKLQPADWGVYPYFRFRRQSGEDKMPDPAWA